MTEGPGSFRIQSFGVFEYDPAAGELRKQGMKLKLQGQPIEILALLLEHPGDVVTREELQKNLWPADTFVDFEHSLNAAVKRLRDALGDAAENPRFIETIARHGYRFIAPVEGIVPAAARSRIVSWIVLGAVAALLLLAAPLALNVGGWRERIFRASTKPISSIAVLPLTNLSGDPDQDYFAEGMTEVLITELGKISALRVISRQSMMQYKGTKKSAPQIASELNVDAVVEGSVLRAGDRVRISVQLIQAAPERHLWANSYDRDLRDVLSLHSEMARTVASEVRAKLTPQEETRLASARPVSPEAYEAYLKGHYEWELRTEEGLKKSLVYFQRAIALEPNYALAYAGLSQSYFILWDHLGPDECVPNAKAAALKSLQIDDNLGEAHVSLALLLMYYDWNWAGSERELRRALELSPSSAVAHYAYSIYLSYVGRHLEALTEIKKARQLDPLSPRISANVGMLLYWARQYDQAIEELNKAIELHPNDPAPPLTKAMIYLRKGMPKEALAEYLKGKALDPSPLGPKIPSVPAEAYVMLGQRDRVRKMAKELEGRAATYVRLTEIALVYSVLGDRQKAFAWLEKAYEQHDTQIINLKVDPQYDPLRSDPRFQDLLRRMNFPP